MPLVQPRAWLDAQRRRSWSSLLIFAAASACGDDVDASPVDGSVPQPDSDAQTMDGSMTATPDAGAGCRTFVSDSLIDHACFHELMGPHVERTAGADPAASGIDVDRAHTSFRVRLAATSGGRFAGVLTYQARSPGDYAIFSRDASVRVKQQGTALERSFSHATEICPVLPAVDVYALAQQTYTLELESDRADVVLVLEYMNEGAVDDAYRVECDSRPRPPRDATVFTLDAASLDASAGLDADDEGGAQADAGMCRVDPVLEHSCLHAQFGPYGDLSVGAGSAAGPDVSKAHTAWRMSLPSGQPGKVSLRPTMTGEYVFYLDRALPLRVSLEGESLSPSYSEPVTTCAGITEARVYTLMRAARYDVELGPTTGDMATMIIESVAALTPNAWSDRVEACP
jgi:hypothetical protein